MNLGWGPEAPGLLPQQDVVLVTDRAEAAAGCRLGGAQDRGRSNEGVFAGARCAQECCNHQVHLPAAKFMPEALPPDRNIQRLPQDSQPPPAWLGKGADESGKEPGREIITQVCR